MFKNLFSMKGKFTKKQGDGALAPAPELERRREEERLRKQFDLSPSKSGSYL